MSERPKELVSKTNLLKPVFLYEMPPIDTVGSNPTFSAKKVLSSTFLNCLCSSNFSKIFNIYLSKDTFLMTSNYMQTKNGSFIYDNQIPFRNEPSRIILNLLLISLQFITITTILFYILPRSVFFHILEQQVPVTTLSDLRPFQQLPFSLL